MILSIGRLTGIFWFCYRRHFFRMLNTGKACLPNQQGVPEKTPKKHGNADALSRLPLKVTSDVVADIADVFEIGQIETMPITARDLVRINQN
ncbi:hypothetical protein AVEN_165713-1 [Araneus ventricosus]|uniref:Uncharacterized protein n=1 Tax=Araneus ventricosus TaxID=182803 RepID=A0A4Y2C5I2_ARAVE|nr:hypothetical protein AVEN_165713-1 [Araneus ventricosus]